MAKYSNGIGNVFSTKDFCWISQRVLLQVEECRCHCKNKCGLRSRLWGKWYMYVVSSVYCCGG